MTPKIKKSSLLLIILTFGFVNGITLAPFGIYIQHRFLNHKIVINHETIHWRQQLEMLIIFFYIWYIIEWFIRIFTNFGNSFENISFEREAFMFENKLNYLNSRKPYSWFKFLVKRDI
jgi:hypothetical protein